MSSAVTHPPGSLVQWAQGSAAGVRSWAYHGIGKVHRLDDKGARTLCGLRPKRPWWSVPEDPEQARRNAAGATIERCARCAHREAS